MGEPAGIGAELVLMAWLSRTPCFFVYDDVERLRSVAHSLSLSVETIPIVDSSESQDAWNYGVPVIDSPLPFFPSFGHPRAELVPYVLTSIERAVRAVQSGRAAAMVTNPIHKSVLHQAGMSIPGHTEYLAHLAGLPEGRSEMLLVGGGLRVVPLTRHLSLRMAIEVLSEERIVQCARTVDDALKGLFDLESPRLAVAALNPHGGEDGSFGSEEIDIIRPALRRLQAQGLSLSGPHSADALFHSAARTGYDAVLCMYHDQALIPVKTIAFDDAVNLTLGLPFIRTSPDHGTALSIAGEGIANPSSFIAALDLAYALSLKVRHKETKASRGA